MSIWATCFSRAGAVGPLLVAGAACLIAAPAPAQAGLTQDEALRLAFPPPATIERRTAFLSAEQLDRVRRLAGPGVAVSDGVVTYYVGRAVGGRSLGVAYFDAHRVRTVREVLMIVVAPDSTVGRVEVLRFQEPPDYAPPRGWTDQLEGRRLDDHLSLDGAVAAITGATLTARAVVRATRRVLAYHLVIDPLASASGP